MNKKEIEIRIERYKTRLDLYYAAEEAILTGAQSYSLGRRNLTRADLSEIRKMIEELENDIDELESLLAGYGRRRAMRAIPRDV